MWRTNHGEQEKEEDLGDKIIPSQGTDDGGIACIDNGEGCKTLSVSGYLGNGWERPIKVLKPIEIFFFFKSEVLTE